MANRTITDEIITIVQSVANNNPAPVKCTIKKVYDDNIHADITIGEDGELNYVETINNNIAEGNTGILFTLDGETTNYIVITK